jgi:NADPH-dependent 2,4-dienoyl-CoA reductase/sulfur reductase-like enzyme
MDHTDVLVGGAGPVGLTAARTAHLVCTVGTSVSTPAARDLG